MAIIYGVTPSPYVRKVMLAHAYKKVPYELKMTAPHSEDEEFRKASPLGKIPGYVSDKGTAFPDSSVIIAYIERVFTEIKLYPENAENLAIALWLEEYCDTKLTEATGALYFQRVIGPKFFSQATDEARVEEVLTKLIPPALDYIESQITNDAWLVNNQFSVADLALGSCLVSLLHADYVIDANKWPKVANYNTRFLALDMVKAQLVQENAMLNPS